MKLEFIYRIKKKYSNIKFSKNTSFGSQVVPCGLIYRRTYMTKLIIAFRNFCARVLKNTQSFYCSFRSLFWKNRNVTNLPIFHDNEEKAQPGHPVNSVLSQIYFHIFHVKL